MLKRGAAELSIEAMTDQRTSRSLNRMRLRFDKGGQAMIMAEKDERSIASSLPLSEASTPPKLTSSLFEIHKTHNNKWRGGKH